MRSPLGRLLSAACLALVGSTPLGAVHPSASYIFPAGAQRGTTVSVRVGGLYLHKGCSFAMLGPGVTASQQVREINTTRFPKVVIPQTYFTQEHSFPRDYAGTVQVADDATLGMRYWQVWTSQGGTTLRRFVIGDLPEVIEREVDGNPIPHPVQLPVTANGRIYPREDVDLWVFEAKAGDSITCEVHAARIGSTLDSHLEIRDAGGQRIAENTDFFGSDSLVRFTVPRDGTYHAAIHDVRFGGLQSSVYRLTITSGPHVDSSFPLGGRRGTEVPLQLLGQHVPAQPVIVTLPADGGDQQLLPIPCGDTRQLVLLDLGDFPEAIEQEPNNVPPKASVHPAPVVLNGRISAPGDVDCWRLTVEEGQTLEFLFRARHQGAVLNPLLVVSADDDSELLRSEGRGRLTFAKAGTYTLRVSERFPTRGGPRFIYRLQVGPPPAANFLLHPAQQALTLTRGGSAELTVNAERLGGFAGEIKLTADQLPEGVTAEPVSIPGDKKVAKLKLQAGPKTTISAARIRVQGAAMLPMGAVTRTATYRLDPGGPVFETVLLTTALSAPFKFIGQYKIPFALRGTTHYRRYEIDRGGFEGTLYARAADQQIRHQMGTWGSPIELPPNSKHFDYPLQVSTWTKVGLTGRTVVVVYGEIVDSDGSRHTVAYSSSTAPDQIMIQPSAGPLSIRLQRSSLVARADRPAQVTVRIRRDPELPLPVTLSLLPGAHVQGVEATPRVLAPDQTEATLEIRFTGDAGPFNAPLVIRATVRPTENITVRGRPLRSGDPIIAEAPLSVVVAR
ncbi:MAG: hypothetical protein CMJ59_16805 [Planctomycetaceae bacterium]|nr:hypothetical protein [Planctomycetaceae bacterium]